jgi:hypothetical protein
MVRGDGLAPVGTTVVLTDCSITGKGKNGMTWCCRHAGDIFRWRNVWPQIADWFGLKAGLPLKACYSFQPDYAAFIKAALARADCKLQIWAECGLRMCHAWLSRLVLPCTGAIGHAHDHGVHEEGVGRCTGLSSQWCTALLGQVER